MRNIDELLQHDNKNKQELLKYCSVEKTTKDDLYEVIRILNDNMHVDNLMATMHQLLHTNLIISESIKIVDTRDGKIYGLLLLSDFNIEDGSPLRMLDPMATAIVSNMKQIHGFLFIIDERLQGCGFDKKMINMAMPFINQHNFLWIGVEKELNTHNYWKRMGLTKGLETNDGAFYFKLLL